MEFQIELYDVLTQKLGISVAMDRVLFYITESLLLAVSSYTQFEKVTFRFSHQSSYSLSLNFSVVISSPLASVGYAQNRTSP